MSNRDKYGDGSSRSTSASGSTTTGGTTGDGGYTAKGPAAARVDTFGATSGGDSGTGSFRAAGDAKDMMQQKTGEVIDQAKEKAGQVVGQVQDQAKTQVSTQKDRLAEGLSSVSQALQQTGQQLQDQDVGPVGQYVNGAADQVDKIANYLKERDVDDILYEVESLARRQPAIFLGGALVLGLLGARFLRSSQQRAYEIQRREAIRSGAAYTGGPYGSTGYGTGAYSGMTGRGTAGGYGTTGGYSQGTGDPYETESLPIYSYDKEDTTLGRGTEG